MTGWIQLHRSLREWEWFTDVNTSHLFIYCLLRANHKDTKWRGIEIARGQFVTSLDTMSKETGLSVMQIRTAIKKLELTKDVTSKPTNKNRLITITNYNKYQDDNKQGNKRITSKQQTNNKQVTTDNNENNNNNENNENNNIIISNEALLENNFEIFWQEYPKNNRGRGSKKEAEAKLKIALKKDTFENIMNGVKEYGNYIRYTGQSNKDAFRWIEKEGWRDDYTIESTPATGRQRTLIAATKGHQRAENPDF